MDYLQVPLDGSYMVFSPEISAYNTQPLCGDLGTTENHGTDLYFESKTNSVAAFHYEHASLQRFLRDEQQATLFNPIPQPQASSAALPVAAFPATAFHHRQHSPISSQDPSSCSSARSPRADTDIFTENMPSTPPDLAMVSHFQTPPYEAYQPKSAVFLSGMGGLVAERHSCVSMADINPAGGGRNEWNEPADAVIDFNSPPGSDIFGNPVTPTFDANVASRKASVDQFFHDSCTLQGPASLIKEESHLVEEAALAGDLDVPYSTPSARKCENFDDEMDLNSKSSNDNDDDDDDDNGDDYQSTQTRTATAVRRAGRNKTDVPDKPLDKAPPKKSKSNPSVTPHGMRPIPPSPRSSKHSLMCHECKQPFKDETTLHTHVRKHHMRPFPCVFGWAGCTATFPNKNEWKRHVMSQDIARHFWVCDIGACARTKHVSSCSSKPTRNRRSRRGGGDHRQVVLPTVGPPLPDGAIFNRKDLYTQHIRRMHVPASTKSSSNTDWDDSIKKFQNDALRERCQLPTYMACPASGCAVAFTGTDAWDQRMEHVARHLERAAAGEEPLVVFGGENDSSLTEWATRADVGVVRPCGDGGGWILNNPLRAAGGGVGRRRNVAGIAAGGHRITRQDGQAKEDVMVKYEDWDIDAEGEEE